MILVVDDDSGIVSLLTRALSQHGYRVESASDGAEAYGHLRSPDCKCILLDINMPRINGVELLMLMQAEGIHIPTIVMAGFSDYDETEMKQFENVAALIQKPFDLDVILKAIKTHARPSGSD
ncbi:MAG: response regulator [Lentisphaerae bacterium]|nr:response regulator [Lentisphaerota bacterium]